MFERKTFKRTPIDKEKNIVNAVIKRVLSKETLTNDVISNEEKDKIPTASINIDYPREKGVHLLKKCSLQPNFKKKGYNVPYRYDRNGKGDGLLLYIRDDIYSLNY